MVYILPKEKNFGNSGSFPKNDGNTPGTPQQQIDRTSHYTAYRISLSFKHVFDTSD